MKFIRTLTQDRFKSKSSLKSVLSLQVNINIPKIEKDHQKKYSETIAKKIIYRQKNHPNCPHNREKVKKMALF